MRRQWLTALALLMMVSASAPVARGPEASPPVTVRATATVAASADPTLAPPQERTRAMRPWVEDRDAPGVFVVVQPGATTQVTGVDVRMAVRAGDRPGGDRLVTERFVGGRPGPVEPGAPTPTVISDFLGNDPSKWRSGVPGWASVRRRDIYPGIDVEFVVRDATLEKVFAVAPGAEPEHILVAVEGVEALELRPDGELALRTSDGDLRFSAPVAWQGEGDTRQAVEVRYRVEERSYGFELGAYDRTKPLVIDPVLISTFVGGDGSDVLEAVALGPDGSVYVVGYTTPKSPSTDPYPTTAGAYDRTLNGDYDVVISRFSADLSTLLASTYVGGSGRDLATRVVVDATGNVVVAGKTFSSNFPTLGTASWEPTFAGAGTSGWEGFVIKLNSSLTSLLGSTYLGGYWYTEVSGLAVHPDGSIFVGGHDDGSDTASWTPPGKTLPTTGYLKTAPAHQYAYVARFNSGLGSMTALTFFHGPRTPSTEGGTTYTPSPVYRIADLGVANGSVYVAGRTRDWTLPTTAGAYDRNYSTGTSFATKNADYGDVFVARFDPGLTTLQASTFLGGRNEDIGKGLAVDSRGNVFVTGDTRGGSAVGADLDPDLFPVTAGAFDVSHNGAVDVFVARLDAGLTTLQASTFIGGSDARDELVYDLVVVPGPGTAAGEGDVFIGGVAWGQIPTGVRAYQETAAWERYGAGWYHENPYVLRLDWKLQRVLAASYLQSGYDYEQVRGVAVTAAAPRFVYLAGYTNRFDFPVTPGAYDTTFGGGPYSSTTGDEGFLARLPAQLAHPGILVNLRGPDGIAPGERGTYTVNFTNGLDMVAHNVVITASVPAGLNLVDIGGGGVFYPGGGGCSGEVLWRVSSMNPMEIASVTFTVETPWGAPDATASITVRGAAGNEATPYFDPAPYLAFQPAPHPTSVPLDADGLAAQLTAFPAARRLLDYARAIGYRFFGTSSLDTLADGTRMLRLHLFAPDGGLATLAAPGDRAFIERFAGDTYTLLDATGGLTWNRAAGTMTPFGGWATTTQPSGPLTLGLGDESDQAIVALAASGFQVARCRFNCMLNSIPDVALSKLSSMYQTVGAGKDCVICAVSTRSGSPNNEACLKCSTAMAEKVERAANIAPVIGDALTAYYVIGNCQDECDKDPNKHICTQDKWECCWTILGWIGGFDVKCRTACNRTTGTYAPVITDRVNCAYGQTCVDGSCDKPTPRCQGVSCAQKPVRSRKPRDPNAKAVSPGGVVLPGDTLTYTIEYENVGAGTAVDVFILDTLDADLDATTLQLDPRCSYSSGGRLISCTIGTLAPAGQAGSKGSVSFSLKPRPGLAMGTEIVNQAEVHFPSGFEITPTNAVVNRLGGLRAEPLRYSTLVATPVPITLRGASADGRPVSYRVTRQPLNGALSGTGTALTYTPVANFTGGDEFEYVVSNGIDTSLPARVAIVVTPHAASDTTRPTVVSTSPVSGANAVVATTLDVGGTRVYGPHVMATFSEPMDPASLTTSSVTVSGMTGQVVYDGQTWSASWIPSGAFTAGATYTATITTAVRDASGNALAANHSWSFRIAGTSEPNIRVALPDNAPEPVTLGTGLANRRRTISVANHGTADLRITGTTIAGVDSAAFRIGPDGCRGQTLRPSQICSLDVTLDALPAPQRNGTLRITSNDPDQPTLDVPLRSTTVDPPAPFSAYLAEGATLPTFDTFVALVNPGTSPATSVLKFLQPDGSVTSHEVAVPARTRRTVRVRDVPGMENAEFATTIESDRELVSERTMVWDRVGRYGAHCERSLPGPSPIWYLAEGATHSGFDLFYLLQNPRPTAIDVTVKYLLPGGVPPIEKTYSVGPNSRQNIWVDLEEIPPGSGQFPLSNTDVGAVLTSGGGEPFIVERAMYLSSHGRFFNAGHESAGITAPALEWFLAEGATGPYFDLFVLIANPNDRKADVEVTYLLPDGTTIPKTHEIEPNSRFNIWVDHEYGDARLADTAVSTTVRSTNGVPVIVERAMWWPGSSWYEAHNSAGATTTGTRWALAEGEVDASRNLETYILIANTSARPAVVEVTLLFEDGTTDKLTFGGLDTPIPARSRFNVPVGYFFPAAAGKRFGAIVESQPNGSAPPAQIVVERAMYWNDAAGQNWAAGTNALATKLQ